MSLPRPSVEVRCSPIPSDAPLRRERPRTRMAPGCLGRGGRTTPPGPALGDRGKVGSSCRHTYRQTVSAAQADGSAVPAPIRCRIRVARRACRSAICRSMSASRAVSSWCTRWQGASPASRMPITSRIWARDRPAADEVQPGHGLRPVVAVPVGGALGRREQLGLLIEPQRLGRGPSCRRQLADAHGVPPSGLTLPFTGRFMMNTVDLPRPARWRTITSSRPTVSAPRADERGQEVASGS